MDTIGKLNKFASITLREMATVRLMNRTDTKFICNIGQLSKLLELATDDYLIQETEGERLLPYTTRYYDTADLHMFKEHQRGRKTRYKIRIRTYAQSGMSFLEIKHKNNHGRTKKHRQAWYDDSTTHTSAHEHPVPDFIGQWSPYHWHGLSPSLNNSFNRITLVNKGMTERLTIDLNLKAENPRTGHRVDYKDLVVIELKRDGRAPSPMLELLKRLRIKPTKFSKYSISVALTSPGLKQNRFKERIRNVQKYTPIVID